MVILAGLLLVPLVMIVSCAGLPSTELAGPRPEERVTFVMHRVAEGETLSHIALQYGVRVAEIEAANPGVRPRYLRIGRTLTVPVAARAGSTAGVGG